MNRYRLGQYCLPLRFIDGYGECCFSRELSALESEWNGWCLTVINQPRAEVPAAWRSVRDSTPHQTRSCGRLASRILCTVDLPRVATHGHIHLPVYGSTVETAEDLRTVAAAGAIALPSSPSVEAIGSAANLQKQSMS